MQDKSFTLQAGTYVINYSAPVFQVNDSKVYLDSVTDNGEWQIIWRVWLQ